MYIEKSRGEFFASGFLDVNKLAPKTQPFHIAKPVNSKAKIQRYFNIMEKNNLV
ncbi:hypothetical protein [uncultured Draconibacterium sp.]|uniref:hypothetical protein n=1 Tax=uncultured Draconibacterium sp. TaxID=1573823 RepID=UPI002AA79BC2|nr:hypothetical protein [uncultured Draconibacterium sp.]